MHDYVTWLRDSSPYINSHRDRTFVVMLPGDGVEHANFANIVHDLVLLHGVRLVLVFGSRPQIEARLAARGITPRFRDLRITDGPTMECVIDAVGQLRIALEARLSMDKAASPMQGARLRWPAATSSPRDRSACSMALTCTTPARCGASIARASVDCWTSAPSCCSRRWATPHRRDLQPGVRDVATRAAIDLQADKLVLYGAETGLLDSGGKLVRELRPQQIPAYVERLGSQYQAELLDAAAQACRGGVRRSHVVSYVDDGALLNELFTRDGAGAGDPGAVRATARGDHRGCRRADRSDHPLEEQGILVRRSRGCWNARSSSSASSSATG